MTKQTLLQLAAVVAAGTMLAGTGSAGYLYVADNRGVTQYSTSGGAGQLVESSQMFQGLTVDSAGDIFGVNSQIYSVGGRGALSQITNITQGNNWNGNLGLAIDASGNFFVGQNFSNSVTEVTPALAKSRFGNYSAANFANGLITDSAGDVFFSAAQAIDEITAGGVGSVFASGFTSTTGLAMDAAGDIFTNDGGIVKEILAGTHTPVTFANLGAGYGGGMVFDESGNLFVENGVNTNAAPVSKLYEFAAGSNTPTLIASNLSFGYGSASLAYSNQDLVGTPEPATWMMMLTGTAAVVLGRRRKKS